MDDGVDASSGKGPLQEALELVLIPSPGLVVVLALIILSGRTGETILGICLILSLRSG